jgi:hypothetical protein
MENVSLSSGNLALGQERVLGYDCTVGANLQRETMPCEKEDIPFFLLVQLESSVTVARFSLVTASHELPCRSSR